MKITKHQLSQIKSRAIRNYVDLAKKDLDADQFLARCWIEAIAGELGIKPEFEERPGEMADE